jgi:hypothetical protein
VGNLQSFAWYDDAILLNAIAATLRRPFTQYVGPHVTENLYAKKIQISSIPIACFACMWMW